MITALIDGLSDLATVLFPEPGAPDIWMRSLGYGVGVVDILGISSRTGLCIRRGRGKEEGNQVRSGTGTAGEECFSSK